MVFTCQRQCCLYQHPRKADSGTVQKDDNEDKYCCLATRMVLTGRRCGRKSLAKPETLGSSSVAPSQLCDLGLAVPSPPSSQSSQLHTEVSGATFPKTAREACEMHTREHCMNCEEVQAWCFLEFTIVQKTDIDIICCFWGGEPEAQ